MSHHPSAKHALLKASEGDEAHRCRKEIIQIFARMAARCEEWLVANGVAVNESPAPDVSDVDVVDYTRHVSLNANTPVNISTLQSLSNIYAAEGALLNNTHHSLMKHHLRFNNDPEDPGYLPVPEQIKRMEAMAAKVRGETDEVTRKTYAVYNSGPPETHRVLPTNDDEDLLQLWAKKRGAPNEAEMYMLAKYIGVDVYAIYDWFKAKDLQTNAFSLVLGEACSHRSAFRNIGILRFRAAQVQSAWQLKLARLRKEQEKAKRAADSEQGSLGAVGVSNDEERKDGRAKGKEWTEITFNEVRGEMKPYICIAID